MEHLSDRGQVRTILIVDDEPVLRMVAADFFVDTGFEVLEAGSADEAMLFLEARSDIAGVFTDVQMPGSIDGVELAIVAALRWPKIRLIVTSGNGKPVTRPLPRQAVFVSKPYNLDGIARLLRAA